jgi:hypothetical protein
MQDKSTKLMKILTFCGAQNCQLQEAVGRIKCQLSLNISVAKKISSSLHEQNERVPSLHYNSNQEKLQ